MRDDIRCVTDEGGKGVLARGAGGGGDGYFTTWSLDQNYDYNILFFRNYGHNKYMAHFGRNLGRKKLAALQVFPFEVSKNLRWGRGRKGRNATFTPPPLRSTPHPTTFSVGNR